ncbi:MAG: hypothetical protein J6V72_02425 [Kiritimatiellae bacterium]|nr:hypothetical protein [Kiritimatiellia bacterium]
MTLPKTGGGTASFTDVTDTTAAASDVATGKYFYTSAGVRTQGTSSGGGGTDHLTLLATKNLGTISTSSTSATDTGQTIGVTGFDAYDVLVCIARTSPHTNGRHVSTVRLVVLPATSSASTKTGATIATATEHYKLSSSGTLSCRAGTTPYGVYVNSATLSTSGTRTITFTIYQRYNSTSTGTINGTYVMDVYGLKLDDLF